VFNFQLTEALMQRSLETGDMVPFNTEQQTLQAHSKQRTIHTQKHDMLPQH